MRYSGFTAHSIGTASQDSQRGCESVVTAPLEVRIVSELVECPDGEAQYNASYTSMNISTPMVVCGRNECPVS